MNGVWIGNHIAWILIVSGVLTCSMISLSLAPRAMSRFIFGEEPASATALLIARSWGAMVAASGLMLIYAAHHAEARLPIMLYSIAGKLGFTVLVFVGGGRYLRRPAFGAAVIDLAIVLLFAWYLAAD
jgi:hypothetical protein